MSEEGYETSAPDPDPPGPGALQVRVDAEGKPYVVQAWSGGVRSAKPAGAWVRISSGDLPVPVELRIHQDAEGRFIVTGLLIGQYPEPEEITSQTLRGIRLGKILAWLLRDYDPDDPPSWTAGTSALAAAGVNSEAGAHIAASRLRGPDDQVLRDFARTYLTELGRQPRRAMTAAAQAHNISRATANRWAAMCRERGYLSQTSPEGESSL